MDNIQSKNMRTKKAKDMDNAEIRTLVFNMLKLITKFLWLDEKVMVVNEISNVLY